MPQDPERHDGDQDGELPAWMKAGLHLEHDAAPLPTPRELTVIPALFQSEPQYAGPAFTGTLGEVYARAYAEEAASYRRPYSGLAAIRDADLYRRG